MVLLYNQLLYCWMLCWIALGRTITITIQKFIVLTSYWGVIGKISFNHIYTRLNSILFMDDSRLFQTTFLLVNVIL